MLIHLKSSNMCHAMLQSMYNIFDVKKFIYKEEDI